MLSTSLAGFSQANSKISTPNPKKKIQIVEVACGECKFGMEGKGCDLAINIDGKKYFVEGTDIHDQGDAHGEDGLCNAVGKAEVQGKIVKNKFKASYFKIVKQ